MKLTIGDPVLVYAPEMNEASSHWGVYAIPRMWRAPRVSLWFASTARRIPRILTICTEHRICILSHAMTGRPGNFAKTEGAL